VNELQQVMRRPGMWRTTLLFAADLVVPIAIFYVALPWAPNFTWRC